MKSKLQPRTTVLDTPSEIAPIFYHHESYFSPTSNHIALCHSSLVKAFFRNAFNCEYDTSYEEFSDILRVEKQTAELISERNKQMTELLDKMRLVTGKSGHFVERFYTKLQGNNPNTGRLNIADLLRIIDFMDKRIDENHENYILFHDTESEAYNELNNWRQYLLPHLQQGLAFYFNRMLKKNCIQITSKCFETNESLLTLEINKITTNNKRKIFAKYVEATAVSLTFSQKELLQVFQASLTFKQANQCYLELRNIVQFTRSSEIALPGLETTYLSQLSDTKKRPLEVDGDIELSHKKQKTMPETTQAEQLSLWGAFATKSVQPAPVVSNTPTVISPY